MVKFTEEILNEKFYFLWSARLQLKLSIMAKWWPDHFAISVNISSTTAVFFLEICELKKSSVNWKYNYCKTVVRGVFRTLSNICDRAFCESSLCLLAVNYFRKTLLLRYFSLIEISDVRSSIGRQVTWSDMWCVHLFH